MTRFGIFCGLALLVAGCGDPAEEMRRSLRGTWISGSYLDTLQTTGSPARATASAPGVLDFHYDPARDSVVIGINGVHYCGTKSITLIHDDSIALAADGYRVRFATPRGADRMVIAGVELRRVSHVPEVSVGEYLVNRYFVATYTRLDSSGRALPGTVAITPAGAVNGLGDVVALMVATDFRQLRPETDVVGLETLFPPDTLYYAWKFLSDTLTAEWIPPPSDPQKPPPEPPGFKLTLLRHKAH